MKSGQTLFGLLVLFQAMVGLSDLQSPRRIKAYAKHPVMKSLGLFIVALTATRDVEIAIISTLIFVIGLYFLREDDERGNYPY